MIKKITHGRTKEVDMIAAPTLLNVQVVLQSAQHFGVVWDPDRLVLKVGPFF